MSNRKHWPINWVDGMKINKSHFRAQEDFLLEQQAILASADRTDFNFGILPDESGREALDLIVTSERVELRYCRAITRGGYYIEVGSANNAELQQPMSDLMYGRDFSASDTWLVLVRILPDERLEFGTPNPEEHPLRHPFATPKLALEIVPAGNIQDVSAFQFALPIGRILQSYQGIERDTAFLPPVVRLNAGAELMQLHQRWKEGILNIEGNAYEIVKKINHKNRSNEGNQLSEDILALTLSVTRYINAHFDQYRMLIPHEAPIKCMLWFMGMARALNNEFRLAGNQENLLKYFDFYIKDSESTALSRVATLLCDHNYNHLNIRESSELVSRFIQLLATLFARLRELDYHEIGNPTIIYGKRTHNQSWATNPTSPPAPPPPPRDSNSGFRITRRDGGGSSTPPPGNDSDGNGGGGWGLDN